ncbi:protein phosphatase 2C domain-containing protein [Streptacidiphilus cavernicola]|uniref:Protein phosphatase 2C domain-containing protein n=1 Tax=Streptacidiphilus cavernicola TaxID=3342716 RepID=A0ABV6VS81_9ACTN
MTLSCPNCAQPVADTDRFCEGCGTALRSAGGAAVPTGTTFGGAGAAAAPAPVPTADTAFGGAGAAAQAPGPTAGTAAPTGTASGAAGSATPVSSVGVGALGAIPPRPVSPPPGVADPRSGTPAPTPPPAAAPATPAAPAPLPAAQATSGSTGDFVLAAPTGVLVSEPEPQPGTDDEDHAPTEPNPVITPGAGPHCVGCKAQRIDADGYCEACGRAQPRPRDHQERALAGVTGVSDRGHRHHRNEDAFAVAATSRPSGASGAPGAPGAPAVVAVVCDGVSSATRPDEASQAAADTASEYLLESLESGADPGAAMHDAIMAAAKRVEDLAAEGPQEPSRNSPACTIVSAVAVGDEVTVGWVGDSRGYWFPDDRSGARRLTVDDSWAARMVEAGLMGEAEAYADPRAHAITGWLGADAIEVEPHTLRFTPPAPGVVLICTDGLWNYWESAADLAAVVPADARTRPLEAARELVRLACERGGHDNITVAVLPCLPPPPAPPAEHPATAASSVPSYTPTELSLPVVGAGEKRES